MLRSGQKYLPNRPNKKEAFSMPKMTPHSSTYFKFLQLVRAIRAMPGLPELDAVEAQVMNTLAEFWLKNQPITVGEAIGEIGGMSSTTAHRRLKNLREKGLIELEVDETDNRLKHVVPTDLSFQYFTQLGKCIEGAQRS
jgi:DNA-binding MarR family transcriptional regulator